MSKSFSWSWSQLENFEGCPWRWANESWWKTVPYVQNDAAKWGDKVHQALEKRTGPEKLPLPPNMAQFEPVALSVVAAELKGAKLTTEQKLAIDDAWRPAGYFRDPNTWCRAITDFTLEKGDHVIIGDYKTGRPKAGSGQLKLAAAVTLAHRPHINKATTTFVWIGERKAPPTKEVITRDQLPEIRAEFVGRVKAMTDAVAAEKFPKRPSGLCGWCSLGRKHCEHWTGNGRS